MHIEVINRSKHPLPQYETENSAGLDIRADLERSITLHPMERALIPTGLFIAIPNGTEAQIRPRSGLAYKRGVTVLNSPGTIDSDYRGEIKVLLVNFSKEIFEIEDGERIAQIVFAKHEYVSWQEKSELSLTVRGEEGFGSTGIE